MNGLRFNAPPGWAVPEGDWSPPAGWVRDPTWPPAPSGWQFWLPKEVEATRAPESVDAGTPAAKAPELGSTSSTSADTAPAHRTAPSADPEVDHLRARVRELEGQLDALRSGAQPVDLDDERVLQEVGIYRYHHPLESAAAYRGQLQALEADIKAMVKQGQAALTSDLFTYNNSLAQGRKMTSEFSRLMLRAYNAEADNCVRSLRAGNVETAKRRLQKTFDAVGKLGAMMEMRISPDFHQLRIEEIELTADHLVRVQEEREAEREERARLREERKAELELAAERARLNKEREHYVNALASLDLHADPAGAAALEKRLTAIDEAIEANDFRTANIRAGYVYVISNRGAFGPGVVKIGMTRRLEPMDRVRELGDASVPFPFDVHALFFADDAVAIEAELHRRFAEQRLNRVNLRREFFFATPGEVRQALVDLRGNLLEYVDAPEATQYFQSRSSWPTPARSESSDVTSRGPTSASTTARDGQAHDGGR